MQDAWWPFRIAAASIGVDHLDAAAPYGWSYKELLAHVGAWEGATANRLAAFRREGETSPPPAETDAFNAQVTAAARGRSPDAVLEDLERDHARLVAEIESLNDAELSAHHGWLGAIIAGNTYDHYSEHQDELLAAVPHTPQQLLDRMEPAWRRFRRDASHVGEVHGAARSPAGMSYKGLLGHAAYWIENMLDELPIRLEGRRSEAEDVDAVNARAIAEADARTTHEVLERLDHAYARARDAVTALPVEVPYLVVRLFVGETYEHFRQHQPHIAAARPRTSDELLARIDEVWRPFRAAIRARGRAGLGGRVDGLDWTYGDLVAHAAGWMEEVPGTIARLRDGQPGPLWDDESIRAFNERSTAGRRLVGAEALLDELDTAHRLLVRSARSLRSEEIPNALGVVAFYSYLHWEEHFGHLGIGHHSGIAR